MAAIDFPNSPVDGQTFAPGTGTTYVYNAAKGLWLANTGIAIATGITPPSNPASGTLWWNAELGVMFIYYYDGNSSQWVPTNAPASMTVPGMWRLIGTQMVAAGSPQPQVDFTAIPGDINELMFHVKNMVPVTNDVGLFMRMFDGTGAIDAGVNYQTAGVLSQTANSMGAAAAVTVDGSNIRFSYNAGNNGVNNLAGQGISVDGKVINIRNAATRKNVTFSSFFLNGANNSQNSVTGGGQWTNTTSVISGLRFFFGSGNIASGAVTLWGSP